MKKEDEKIAEIEKKQEINYDPFSIVEDEHKRRAEERWLLDRMDRRGEFARNMCAVRDTFKQKILIFEEQFTD